MSLKIMLALFGTLSGLIYAVMGLIASQHPADTDSLSSFDKTVGWTLWWWLEREKYDADGQRLCNWGMGFFALGISCWVGWYAI